jgi:hypothetical protein
MMTLVIYKIISQDVNRNLNEDKITNEKTSLLDNKVQVQNKETNDEKILSNSNKNFLLKPRHRETGNVNYLLKYRVQEPANNVKNSQLQANSPVQPILYPRLTYDTLHFFVVSNIKCEMSTCPPPSYCQDVNTCKCGDGVANFSPPGVVLPLFCQYKQKQKLTFFLLEFFIPGVGHFYIGSILLGILKILLFCTGTCCASAAASKESFTMIFLIFQCGVCLWYTVDLVLIATDFYRDGNTVPLQQW